MPMIRLAAAAVLASLLFLGGPSPVAAEGVSLNWGSEVNPSRCPNDQGYRYLEINVTRKVEGDSTAALLAAPWSTLGSPWATVEYNQHIQVWQIGTTGGGGGGTVGAERFCALVHYQGSFTTHAGPSPAGSSLVAEGIDGSFQGGYRLVFNADEKSGATPKVRGHLGTVPAPDDIASWRRDYFDNIGLDQMQWLGFIFHGGNNGAYAVWNSQMAGEGRQGDITD